MSAPLYSLAAQYQQLLDRAESGEDVTDALDALDDALEAKAGGIVRVLAQLEADAEAAEKEARRLLARAKARTYAALRLRDYVKTCMQTAGVSRVKGPLFSLTLSAGQPRVEVHDLDALPPELVRVVPEQRAADKIAIARLHRETGEIPPGCEIVATTKLTVR